MISRNKLFLLARMEDDAGGGPLRMREPIGIAQFSSFLASEKTEGKGE